MQTTDIAEPIVLSRETFLLRLYVAGQTPKCIRAFANLDRYEPAGKFGAWLARLAFN